MFQGNGDLFYDKEDNIIADTSPAVKNAWDTATSMADISAKARPGRRSGRGGFKQGTFAADLLPVLDARHRLGELRSGQQGQVGRRVRAGRRR